MLELRHHLLVLNTIFYSWTPLFPALYLAKAYHRTFHTSYVWMRSHIEISCLFIYLSIYPSIRPSYWSVSLESLNTHLMSCLWSFMFRSPEPFQGYLGKTESILIRLPLCLPKLVFFHFVSYDCSIYLQKSVELFVFTLVIIDLCNLCTTYTQKK
jgi:hypothetical protein